MIKHYKNEAGTLLLLDTGVAIGTATDFRVLYTKPGGSIGSFSGAAYSSFSQISGDIGTYFVSHTLVTTDFDTSGKWKLQAYVGHSSGTWYGETVDLQIFDLYE